MKTRKESKYKKLLIHISSLLVLFGTPVLFNDFYQSESFADIVHKWLPLISFTIVFYVNYFFLIDKYFFHKKNVLFILLNVLMFITIIVLMHLVHELVWDSVKQNVDNLRPRPSNFYIFYSQFFSLIVSTLVSIAIKSVQNNNRMEKEKKEIERIHLTTELNQLKQQINPHFLFNTLNNIYSLIAKDQTKAQEAVHRLSHMMRYVLYESQSDFLPISSELSFIKNYINLMKLRLSGTTKLNVEIADCSEEYFIAPLVLIAFVENAFKHSSGAANNSFINIKIDFIDNMLNYTTENSIGSEQKLEGNNSGFGLLNLSKRLTLLYGNDFALSNNREGNTFYSKLELKLRK